MSDIDIRWKQRLENFKKAYGELREAVELSHSRPLSKLEIQGLIQSFEYTHELAWNTLKDYFKDQGTVNITGSKDATRQAFKMNLIENGEAWMDMIKSRNLTSHTYNKETAETIATNIIQTYFQEFTKLIQKLDALS